MWAWAQARAGCQQQRGRLWAAALVLAWRLDAPAVLPRAWEQLRGRAAPSPSCQPGRPAAPTKVPSCPTNTHANGRTRPPAALQDGGLPQEALALCAAKPRGFQHLDGRRLVPQLAAVHLAEGACRGGCAWCCVMSELPNHGTAACPAPCAGVAAECNAAAARLPRRTFHKGTSPTRHPTLAWLPSPSSTGCPSTP